MDELGPCLRTASPKYVQQALNPYFNEIKLADIVSEYAGHPFISTWRIANSNKTICLPLQADGVYDFVVDWGDGHNARIRSHDQPEAKHVYALDGEYVAFHIHFLNIPSSPVPIPILTCYKP